MKNENEYIVIKPFRQINKGKYRSRTGILTGLYDWMVNLEKEGYISRSGKRGEYILPENCYDREGRQMNSFVWDIELTKKGKFYLWSRTDIYKKYVSYKKMLSKLWRLIIGMLPFAAIYLNYIKK
jgi:hypothetical protein